jgi:hypothetical protein
MTPKAVLVLLATFHLTIASAQDSTDILQLDKAIVTIDSIIAVGTNIEEYIRPLHSDDGGGVFLNHHYTIDTTKRILYKAVYDYLHFEQVTFYYNNQKIVKAIVSDISGEGRVYKCEYYFDHAAIIWVRELGTSSSKNSWNKKTVASLAGQYLIDFSGICEMLDKQK